MRSVLNRRWVPAAATLMVAALCAALGVWQLDRARETLQLQARYEQRARDSSIEVSSSELRSADVDLRRVTAHGTFDPRYVVFIDNRVLNGVPGYDVVMPLRLAGGDRYVLVNRGWVAGVPDRSRLPEVRTPASPVEVSGIAVVPERKPFELSSDVMEGQVWENLTIARFRHAYPIAIQPFVIEEDNDLGDGLARVWEKPDFGLERHYGYAFQWFLLGATALVIYGVSYVRRRRTEKKKSNASLWLIIAICAAPVIASYIAYYWWQPTGRLNYGELLTPRPLPDPALQSVDGTPFKLSELKGKWIYLVADSGACRAYCAEKLFYIRQLRLTQGKDSIRIERVWLLTDNITPDPALLAQFKGTYAVRAAGSALLAALPTTGRVSDDIYIVDPLGNLMMRYPRGADPRRMVKDIAQLLRHSQWAD